MSESFETVVVGYDARPQGDDAVALGALVARETGARLAVAMVYPDTTLSSRYGPALQEEAQQRLEQLVLPPGSPEPELVPVAASSPARGLRELAEVEEADVLVVGSTHRGKLGRAFPGSVAQRLLHGSPCAVLIAPRRFAERSDIGLRVIGVGYSPIPESDDALAVAERLALETGAALRVITAVDAAATGLGLAAIPGEAGEYRLAMERALQDATALLAPETRAEPIVARGNPAVVLAERAEALDLLVVGSRAFGPVGRVVIGSVAGQLVRSVSCPLMVVPRRARRPIRKQRLTRASEASGG